MKKSTPKKLTISRETVRSLEPDLFPQVQGGLTSACFSSGSEDLCITRTRA